MKNNALERDGEVDMVKCCVQADHTKDLIPALFFITVTNKHSKRYESRNFKYSEKP